MSDSEGGADALLTMNSLLRRSLGPDAHQLPQETQPADKIGEICGLFALRRRPNADAPPSPFKRIGPIGEATMGSMPAED